MQKLTLQLVLCADGAFWGVAVEWISGCLCDGKEGVEAKPLCEAGTLGFGLPPFLDCTEVMIPLCFGQRWVVGVERGHRWSLVGRYLGRDEGTSIAALVAFCVHRKVIRYQQEKLDLGERLKDTQGCKNTQI